MALNRTHGSGASRTSRSAIASARSGAGRRCGAFVGIGIPARAFELKTRSRDLFFHLRNAAKWPVATPAVFLSLKNSDGQVLVKRVFLPAELGLPSSTLAAREEYIGNALLDVADNELSNAIADYEMKVFYP